MLEPFDLNLRHLRALESIVARGSMSAAAEAVSLSQPALTQGLAKLERQIGVALFDRRPNGMSATAAGILVAQRARAAFAHLAAAARAVSRSSNSGFARFEQLMTATQLRAFLALADAGSFTGAAHAAGLSQPALHRAVRDLETLGAAELVERRGRGVALTPAGRRLARGVRLAAVEIAAAIYETGPEPERAGRLVIGAMPLSRAQLVPVAVAGLVRAAPRATIDIVEGSWRDLVEPLRDGVIDLMIGALREGLPSDLTQTALMVDSLGIVARAGHPLAGPAAPSHARLSDYPWIVARAGAPLRGQWEQIFAGGPLPPAPIECGSVMVIRALLRDGDFLTLLSPDQIASEVRAGILALVGPPLGGMQRAIGVTTRTSWRPTETQARFLTLLGEAALQNTLPEIQ